MLNRLANTKLVRYPARLSTDGPVVATLGNFDGIHTGHQSLLEAVAESADSISPDALRVVVSFHPHPAIVLGKSPGIPRITTPHQNIAILSSFGVDYLYMVRFTPRLSELSATRFLDEILIDRVGVDHMVLGPDASVGHRREGDADFIGSYLSSAGKSAQVLPFVEKDGERVSSRRIRTLISNGSLDAAAKLLGRRFALEGRIVKGEGRGSALGIPTANIHVREQVLPPYGVYTSRAVVEGSEYRSVTNIGIRPTFGGGLVSVETHMLDMPPWSLYGRRLEVEPIELLRPERKFASPDELVRQIRDDIEQARKRFG